MTVAIAEIDAESLAALTRELTKVAADMRSDILADALDQAADPILSAMQAKCPIGDTGDLYDSLEKKRTKRKGLPAVTVGTKAGAFAGKTFYASFIELGHFVGSRKLGDARHHVAARPFMRPAYMENKRRAQGIVMKVIRQRLAQIAGGA